MILLDAKGLAMSRPGRNLFHVPQQVSMLAVVAFAMTAVMAMGDYDLCVGSMASLAGIVARHDLPRAPLEAMLDARYDDLGGRRPLDDDLNGWADAVGGGLMALAARILDPASDPAMTAAAGRLFALGRQGAPPARRAPRR